MLDELHGLLRWVVWGWKRKAPWWLILDWDGDGGLLWKGGLGGKKRRCFHRRGQVSCCFSDLVSTAGTFFCEA